MLSMTAKNAKTIPKMRLMIKIGKIGDLLSTFGQNKSIKPNGMTNDPANAALMVAYLTASVAIRDGMSKYEK